VGQSSSQHDKCQVGNMDTYSLALVNFPIIQSSIQSFHDHSLTHLVSLHTFQDTMRNNLSAREFEAMEPLCICCVL
jgi:hypothetical protein